MSSASLHRPFPQLEYDGVALGRAISARRASLGMSTRELAAHASISQSYVVALERGRRSTTRRPVPTLDVVIRVARALDMPPGDLFDAARRATGGHVLLVCDSVASISVETLVALSGHQGRWVVATTSSTVASREVDDIIDIDLRRGSGSTYRPAAIVAALEAELLGVRDLVVGQDLGLAFVETAQLLETIDAPDDLLRFEHQWGAVVRDALDPHQARDLWNVCVYTPTALRRLDDPVTATLELLRAHDAVWWVEGTTVVSGNAAVRHLLVDLRPEGTDRAGWSHHVDELVVELSAAA